ncbi:LemA family protein [Parendozoicomonas haliclonae]|uniref:LemA family protein n=1 Tax=Parendozoicomonas haliclonae TaxID=1960125 RepID=A0A1X7AG80_9GAMM|nr:LemA family protein [Parendozoicomonas haliclonae]SMA37995.1 LemA family protein [Parendozoicomonas haliclonae]
MKFLSWFAGLLVLSMITAFTFTGWQWNNLIEEQESVDEAWAQVESQYQRRADLIPALVKTVRASADHEQTVLVNVTAQRALTDSLAQVSELSKMLENNKAQPISWKNSDGVQQLAEQQQSVDRALNHVFAVAESYPLLTASENFLALQAQLEGTENRINIARVRFNREVKTYNATLKGFPGFLLARLGDFTPGVYFKAEKGSRHAPQLDI